MTPPADHPARKHRILVADDHALVREGIGKVLALGGGDLVVAAQATTAAEVLTTLQRGEIDLVLLDLLMPGAKDVDLIRRLAAAHPKLPILVLTMHADPHVARRALEAGALGYLTKLAEMGIVPRPRLDAAQAAIVAQWERFNAQAPGADEIESQVRSVMEQVPDTYITTGDFARVTAGVDPTGTMGRRGLAYLRGPASASAVVMDVDVPAYAARFPREARLTVRTFERDEATATMGFSGLAQRVSVRAPLPAAASRYPVWELEWRFNYDECQDPTRCAAARLVSVRSE